MFKIQWKQGAKKQFYTLEGHINAIVIFMSMLEDFGFQYRLLDGSIILEPGSLGLEATECWVKDFI